MQASLENDTLRLAFDGDILSTNVAAHRFALLSHLAAHPTATTVIADIALSKVIDSQGLNLLIALYRECERRKLAFHVENPASDIQRLFIALKLAERFGLHATLVPT
jgi:ABC-type transporter Mla MlaB component